MKYLVLHKLSVLYFCLFTKASLVTPPILNVFPAPTPGEKRPAIDPLSFVKCPPRTYPLSYLHCAYLPTNWRPLTTECPQLNTVYDNEFKSCVTLSEADPLLECPPGHTIAWAKKKLCRDRARPPPKEHCDAPYVREKDGCERRTIYPGMLSCRPLEVQWGNLCVAAEHVGITAQCPPPWTPNVRYDGSTECIHVEVLNGTWYENSPHCGGDPRLKIRTVWDRNGEKFEPPLVECLKIQKRPAAAKCPEKAIPYNRYVTLTGNKPLVKFDGSLGNPRDTCVKLTFSNVRPVCPHSDGKGFVFSLLSPFNRTFTEIVPGLIPFQTNEKTAADNSSKSFVDSDLVRSKVLASRVKSGELLGQRTLLQTSEFPTKEAIASTLEEEEAIAVEEEEEDHVQENFDGVMRHLRGAEGPREMPLILRSPAMWDSSFVPEFRMEGSFEYDSRYMSQWLFDKYKHLFDYRLFEAPDNFFAELSPPTKTPEDATYLWHAWLQRQLYVPLCVQYDLRKPYLVCPPGHKYGHDGTCKPLDYSGMLLVCPSGYHLDQSSLPIATPGFPLVGDTMWDQTILDDAPTSPVPKCVGKIEATSVFSCPQNMIVDLEHRLCLGCEIVRALQSPNETMFVDKWGERGRHMWLAMDEYMANRPAANWYPFSGSLLPMVAFRDVFNATYESVKATRLNLKPIPLAESISGETIRNGLGGDGAASAVSNGTASAVSNGTASAVSNGSASAASNGSASAVSNGTASAVSNGSASAASNGTASRIDGRKGSPGSGKVGSSADAIRELHEAWYESDSLQAWHDSKRQQQIRWLIAQTADILISERPSLNLAREGERQYRPGGDYTPGRVYKPVDPYTRPRFSAFRGFVFGPKATGEDNFPN